MYTDLYLLINDKTFYKFKDCFKLKKNPINKKPIPKNTSTDNFMKFQWPWLL